MGIHILSENEEFDKYKLIAVINNAKKKKHKENDVLAIDNNSSDGNPYFLKEYYTFEPVNDPATRKINYVAGASGSGKSTFTKNLIIKHHILFPDSPIYLFSRLREDIAFDKLEENKIIIRIPIDETFAAEPIDMLSDIPDGSMVVFDDVDTFTDKNIMKNINDIKLQILELGRHKKIYCIITSHLINSNDRNATRVIMNELSTITIFPRGGGSAY